MAIMDSLLGWLLYLDPALGIIIISLILSLIITFAIKFLTDQNLMKDMRDEMKELQKEMKDLSNNPKKLAKANTRFMETNMKYMNHSMKPTLYTFIPILLVFTWLNSHLGYYPLLPNQPFQIIASFEKPPQAENISLIVPEGVRLIEGPSFIDETKRAWLVEGGLGKHRLTLSSNNFNYSKDILITNERTYEAVEQDYRKHMFFFSSPSEGGLNKIAVGNKKILPFANVPIVKEIPWVSGWSWFGAYVVFSLIFSMALRRMFNIY